MPANVVGDALDFAIASDEASLTTQSVSVTQKSDKKEARNKDGDVVAVAFYNNMTEVRVEGLGQAGQSIGGTISLANGTAVGTLYVEEVTIDFKNDDFVKSSVKATAWEQV